MHPPPRPTQRSSLRLGLGLLGVLGLPALVVDYGLDAPTPIGTFLNGALPRTTPTGVARWALRPAFPNLTFDDTTVIRPAPNSTRLYVGSREGVIYSFENDPDVTTKDLFLDISDRVAVVWDGGYLGLAFHPEFGQSGSANRGWVYTFYCATDTGNYPRDPTAGFFDVYLRLSRFWVPDGSLAADANSEEVMFNIRLYNSSHRAGDITFGPDGFLYVPTGESFNFEPAQNITDNLEGGILRIDVDSDATRSHAPRRTLPLAHADEISGQHYWIPDDNPFLDPAGGIMEEYYSVGHRNPHRLTFDTATGRLWSGEIGSSIREEINVIVKGGNQGWPFREGLQPGPRNQPPNLIGTLKHPVLDFARAEARAIIGGYVYRGSDHPSLVGQYVCGDYIHRNIWALTYDEVAGTATKQLLTTFDPGELATFGQDHAGEIYLGGLGLGLPLQQLTTIIDYVGDAPPLLSQTGAFTDLTNLTPAPGIIPYDVNAPLWSDGAAKRRWIAIGNDGTHDTPEETIDFSQEGNWDFPVGTVLIKHFEMPTDTRNPSIVRRLETRFFVKGEDDAYYGVTYRWRPDGSEADLMSTGSSETLTIQTSSGTRQQEWTYPDRTDCRSCHTAAAGTVLGVRTHQLNGDTLYPSTGRVDNQLRTWNHLGIFSTALVEEDIPTLASAVHVDDMTASIGDRARSYIDTNCSSCHQPGTANRSPIDARLRTPLFAQQLVHGTVLDDLGITGGEIVAPQDLQKSLLFHRLSALDSDAMPPIAKNLLDEAGLEVIAQWINGLSTNLQPFKLGNPIESAGLVDFWVSNLIVNTSDTYVNETNRVQDVRVAAFRFWANASTGTVTPFIVRVVGVDDFRVAAIGTPRTQYDAGENVFAFHDGSDPTVRLRPGETLAIGFLDSTPEGGGTVPSNPIPYCVCNGGDVVWHTGSIGIGNEPRVVLGQAPIEGSTTQSETRDYAFAIEFFVARETSSSGRFHFGLDAPFQLGNPTISGTLDPWSASLVVDPNSAFTNNSGAPQNIDVMLFRFHAEQLGSPVTPFVVKVRGTDDYQIVAIGTTRTALDYSIGPNLFFFHDSGLLRIVLAPGETLATGFLDANPDGTGGSTPVIPYQTGNPVWLTGGPAVNDSGRIQFGVAPFPGMQVPPSAALRAYAYAIDFLLR